MSSPSSEIAYIPAVKAVRVTPGSRAMSRPQPLPQMRAEDVARTLLRLQMRIRELETELAALKAAPAGWR
jgi:hypothetical protein